MDFRNSQQQQEQFKVVEGGQIEQLKDIMFLLQQKMQEFESNPDLDDNKGQMRIVISDYMQIKRKFQAIYSLSFDSSCYIDQNVLNTLQQIKEDFQKAVLNFEKDWTQSMHQIAAQQEDPTIIMERKSSKTALIKQVTQTALAMKNKTDGQQRLLDFGSEIENRNQNILAEVKIDNQNYKSKSILSISSTSSNSTCCCKRCTIQ